MISLSLSADQTLVIDTPGVTLRDIQPILNSAPLEDWSCEVTRSDSKQIELRYTSASLGRGAFGIQVAQPDAQGHIRIQYWVERLPQDLVLDSFGLCCEQVENLRQYLRNGYFSWDGSYYVQPDTMAGFEGNVSQFETGYGMCQLLPRHGSGSLILGFDRHDRFQQTFTFDVSHQPISLTIQTWWDRKDRSGLEHCESEQLIIFDHAEVENGLREWAQRAANASPIPPRLSAPPITGWCSWYNLYAYINEENILDHLHAVQTVARRENLPMRIFQIDDGFTPEMGDWLEVRPQFPRGMKPLLDDIRSAGFISGLWIAPFMVGNRSRLYRDHPDWVVKDRTNGQPLAHMRFYGEFRWHKRSEEYYIIDATHPDAFEYLRKVFHTWRHEWGCEYFKTDFMHFGSEYGPDRARWHTPGLTRIEIWRCVAEMIREEIGEAIWLGCGCPLWASIGLVDGVRIGRDVGVSWSGDDLSAQSLLRDQACRNFANHILWQSDPDCVLLRERFSDLSEEEIKTLAIYAGMTGGVMMTSDHLEELSPNRLKLWRLILSEDRASCDFPLMGQSDIFYKRLVNNQSGQTRYMPRAEDGVLVQVRHPAQEGAPGAVFFLNTGGYTVQRNYPLAELGIKDYVYLYSWENGSSSAQTMTKIAVTLPGHHSALYFFSRDPIRNTPLQLPS